MKNIIVVGGGFAGLNFALNLKNSNSYHITLIDKNNYNYFTPLLYQVATSFLDPSSISYPFRKLFRNKNIAFRMAEVKQVKPEDQVVVLNDGTSLRYDELVFAAGASTNFYGNEIIKRNAISLKGIDDALNMRNALLKTLEEAMTTPALELRKQLLTIVVAGGGPTGVEVAGMLAEMKKYILNKDYPELEESYGDIYIIDGGSTLLAPMSAKTHAGTYKAMTSLGVKVILNAHVNDFADNKVILNNGQVIEAKTLIWAAGITANVFNGIPASSLGSGNRMITDSFNKVKDTDHIWAIGDISIQKTDDFYTNGHPQLAQVAIQQGRNLAKNFGLEINGKPMKPFKYFDKGEMAIVGRHHAVVDLFKHKVHFKGFPALTIWLFIHVVSLINFDNKVRTLYSWLVAYISRDQSLRMIFRS